MLPYSLVKQGKFKNDSILYQHTGFHRFYLFVFTHHMDLLSGGNEPEGKPVRDHARRETVRLPDSCHRLIMGLCIQHYCRHPALPRITPGTPVQRTLRAAYEKAGLARA